QNPDNQIVASVVEEDVAFAPENLGVEPSKIRKIVDDCLKTVGMEEYALHSTYKLSGGQKQRVAIAGVLAMSPSCIIFDEATAMLDPTGRKDITTAMKKLNK
ncbi:MAG TPA: energy-coupling factor transporter ATPase, partial [Clostridiales bacterium]|nr:energy-coupling factor transporter ATPase [Clostridiales bacterium]